MLKRKESGSQILKTNVPLKDKDKILQQSYGRGQNSGRGRGRGRDGTSVHGRGRPRQRVLSNSERSNNYARGRNNFNNKIKGGRNRYDKSYIQCNTCQKHEHYSYECRSKNEERAHYVEAKKEEEISKEERKEMT